MRILNWKVYFLLIVTYQLCAVIYLELYAEFSFNINTAIHWFSTIGLWGLAYQKRLLVRFVWIVTFWALMVSFIHAFLVMPFVYYKAGFEVSSIITILAFLLPDLLLPIALFKYCHKSKDLWQSTNKPLEAFEKNSWFHNRSYL